MSNTIFTPANIFKAYLDCRKTKRQTINALKYELNLESNLAKLQQELATKTYYPSRSICFVVTTPKPREIFAAEFNDRIVHHILINQVQHIWEKRIFIPNSYACRKGKGHHYGVSHVLQFAKQFAFYGQFDIANFFSSIDKDILYDCFSRVILKAHKPNFWKEEILWLAKTIIFHDPTQNFYYKGNPRLIQLVPFGKSLFDQNEKTGLPIGNLTSQFFANVYLNELDQYITKTLRCLAYGRYVDDFLLFSDTREEILRWRNAISIFLASNLHLSLHPRKQQIQPTRHGIPFVGYFIKPWGVTVRRNVVKNIKSRLYVNNKRENFEYLVRSVNSYFGHLRKAKTNRLRQHLIEKHLSPEIKSQIEVVGNWKYLRLKKKRRSSL